MRHRVARQLIPIVVVGALALAGLVFSSATAQPAFETFVVSDFPVSPVNGFATIPDAGTDAGIVGAQCAGARPLAGPAIPISAVTALDADAIRLRVVRQGGTALTGPVLLNCTVTAAVGTTGAAKLRRLAK